MLGKLLKYELKATSRVFVPLYIAILVVSIVNGLSLNLEILNIQGLATIVLMCLFISLFVITIVVTIQRFNKNLLKDEGYLMFTLPVSSKYLVLSKYLTSLIWTFLSFIVALLSFTIIIKLELISDPATFNPSPASPPEREPSSIIAIIFSLSPFISLALARPVAKETEVEVWPTLKKSCSLSSGFV